MDVNYYKQYEPIFGAWKIKNKLGEGNFGAVYEIEREDFGTTYHSALKTITIPKNQSELESILDDGMDATSAESYLEQFVEKIVSEFVLMSKLKGNSHIVSYEDHQVIKHKDGIGWDILIRMELLMPMMSYMKTTSITKRDVIKLGIDMCRALELCQKYNIIHRDIKPENIFISDSGDFKLGDFGIAKEVEKTQSGLTKTGTQTYMAPEVYKGQPYGSSVDMYSLGVVLYRLLNHNRAPFMPQYPNPISYSDRERALIMRMGGHHFPAPSGVEKGCRLAEIAMKACSFNPDDRYSSPTQMREDLEAIMYSEGEGILMFPSGDSIDIKSVNYVSNSKSPNRTEHLRDEQTEVMGIDDATEVMEDVRNKFNTSSKKAKKKNNLKFIIPAVAVAASVIVGTAFWINNRNNDIPVSVAVNSVSELNEPIEFKFETPVVTENDYSIIEKRLESYGAKYYLDKASNTVMVSKSDLGSSTQEILATINMITGKGEIKISNAGLDSEFTLINSDFSESSYVFDEGKGESTFALIANESGKEKLANLTTQIIASENKELVLAVDGNIRMSMEISDKIDDGKIAIIEKNGESKNILAALANSFTITAHAEEVKLSANYMKLIVSFVNDGVLTNSYKIFIDEKYGLVLPTEEPEPEITEEPEQNTEPVVEDTTSNTKSNTVDKKSSNQQQQKPTQQKPTQQKPAQQKPASQPVQEQPTQQAPTQQAPAQQAPVQQPQQTTPPASNPAGMPEVYIDFD